MKKTALSIITVLAVAALSVSAYPPPEKDKLTLAELQKRKFEFDGKIIEIEVTSCRSIQQTGPGKYSAYCRFYNSQDRESAYETIYFLKDEDGDALEFFEELDEKSSFGVGRVSFYVLVEKGNLTALGEKYRKSKGTYRW